MQLYFFDNDNFTVTFIVILHTIGYGSIGHKPLIALETRKPLGTRPLGLVVIDFKKVNGKVTKSYFLT